MFKLGAVGTPARLLARRLENPTQYVSDIPGDQFNRVWIYQEPQFSGDSWGVFLLSGFVRNGPFPYGIPVEPD